MKKSGSVVFFMELMIVVLFFSIAVVIVLNLFTKSHLNERESSLRTAAVIEMQNTAELFKTRGFDIFPENGWIESEPAGSGRSFTKQQDDAGVVFKINLSAESRAGGQLDSGEIKAYRSGEEDQDPLCSLKLSRYDRTGGQAAQ